MTVLLDRIARAEHLLVALDFDGTLAPFVVDPMTARMLPQARAVIEQLAALPHTTVALVSGRSIDDLKVIAEWNDEAPFLLAGSHGAEFSFDAPNVARDEGEAVSRMIVRSREVLTPWPEVRVEPKALGVGIHTRGLNERIEREAFAAVDALFAAEASDWRRRLGDRVLEFSVWGSGKDDGIAVLADAVGGVDAVFFAGDDSTDEDALHYVKSHYPGRSVGIRIAAAPTDTSADLVVPSPDALIEILGLLAAQRATMPPR